MKKILSFVAAFGVVAAMAVSAHAANNPQIILDVESDGLTAGSIVTLTGKYAGYNDITPYDDEETGNGSKLTGCQIKINVPGGIGKPSEGEQFTRAGIVYTNLLASGTMVTDGVLDVDNNKIVGMIMNSADPMNPSGDLFTIKLKLNKDVTEDLVFTVDTTYSNLICYNTYEEWEWDGVYGGADPATDSITNTVSATLAGPVVEKDPYELSAAAAGNDVDGQATFYTTVTVNEAKADARFQIVKDSATTKSWALPAICGSGSFVAIVGTNNETGSFACSIVDSAAAALSDVVTYAAN